MTAINIPDMYQIVIEHGLIPVPFDVDVNTMMPVGLENLKAIVSDKTCCVLFAYLYGIQYDISQYLEFLNSKNISIVEDVA